MYFAQVETKVKKFSTGRRQIEKANFVGSLSLPSSRFSSLFSCPFIHTHTYAADKYTTHTHIHAFLTLFLSISLFRF